MRRRDVMRGAGAIVVGMRAARAQKDRTPVVGFLGISAFAPLSPFLAEFHEALRHAGYVEGRNIAFAYRWAEGRRDRLPELAAELVAAHVDVIATSGGLLAAQAAKHATSTIPIVFETGVDPVATGLVASMARPGGNLTGVAILTGELNPKRFELLTEMVPHAAAIALLVNSRNTASRYVIEQVQEAARSKSVRLEIVGAGSEDEYEPALALARDKADGLLVANDVLFFSRRERLVELAARHAMPAMYEWRDFVEIGGLMSYGASLAAMYRELGRYVGLVLAGTKPAELPVMQAAKFELVINTKTAHALGLVVPQSLLARADDVIE